MPIDLFILERAPSPTNLRFIQQDVTVEDFIGLNVMKYLLLTIAFEEEI